MEARADSVAAATVGAFQRDGAKADRLHAITGQKNFAVSGAQATSLPIFPLPRRHRARDQRASPIQHEHIEPPMAFEELVLLPRMAVCCTTQGKWHV